MPERAWFIPDDWTDGDDWTAYCIQWPNSWQWRLQLKSLLFTLTMGRSWDRETGVIKDAQKTGWDIFDRNHDFLVSCGDGVLPGTDETPTIVYLTCGATCEESEDDMPCIDLSTKIKIEDGHLWVKDDCCQWVDLGSVGASAPGLPAETPEEFIDPGTGEPITDDQIACRIAYGIAQRWHELGLSCINAAYSAFPWNWGNYVRQRNADLELQDGELSQPIGVAFSEAVLNLLEIDTFIQMADMNLDDMQQLTCDFYQIMLDYRDAGSWFHDDMAAAMRARVAALGGNPVLRDGFRLGVWDALDTGSNLLKIAGASVNGQSATCGCPEIPPSQELFQNVASSANWRYVFDFRDAPPDYVILNADAHHEPGEGIWSEVGDTSNNQTIDIRIPLDLINNGSVLTNIGLIFKTRGNENYNDATGNYANAEDTSHFVLADFVAKTGENPAQAGVWEMSKVVNDPLTAGEDVFRFNLNLYHNGADLEPVLASSVVVVAILVAGTGTGPLSNPPA